MIRMISIAAIVLACCLVQGTDIRPGCLYEATFRARIAKGPCLEDYPQLEDVVPMTVSRREAVPGARFPGINWRFRNEKGGKVIHRPYEGASAMTLFFREWKSFAYRFYAPEGATCVEFYPENSGTDSMAEIADVSIRELPSSDTMNTHPSFDDAYAAPGWQLVGPSLYLTDRDGCPFVLAEGGRLSGDMFPVTSGNEIAVTMVGMPSKYVPAASRSPGAGSRRSLRCRLAFYGSYADAASPKGVKWAKDEVNVNDAHHVAEKRFKVPDGMRWARLQVWNGRIGSVTVRKVEK